MSSTPESSETQDELTRPVPAAISDAVPFAALAAALLTVALWASAFVAIRHVGEQISTTPLTLARLCVGSMLLGALLAVRRPVKVARRDLPGLFVCGVVWYAGYNVLLNAAEQDIDAGTASMLVNVGPIVIAVVAAFWLKERVSGWLVAGTALGLSGTALIANATYGGDLSNFTGTILGLAAGLAYATGILAQKPLSGRLPAVQITLMACVIGALVCSPSAPTLLRELSAATPGTILWVLYLGVFPTAVAFTTWSFALAHTPASQLGATTYLIPPIAIGLSLLFLGEIPTPLGMLGGAICLLGVYLTRRNPRESDSGHRVFWHADRPKWSAILALRISRHPSVHKDNSPTP